MCLANRARQQKQVEIARNGFQFDWQHKKKAEKILPMHAIVAHLVGQCWLANSIYNTIMQINVGHCYKERNC
jgi:hypothetical protein